MPRMSDTLSKNRNIMSAFRHVYLLLFLLLIGAGPDAKAQSGWKAGVARMDITPDRPMWMAGYAARDHASEGTLHKLWVKALALEDARGHRAVLVTSDLLGVPAGISNNIRDRLRESLQLERSQILFNTSHTHSGPVLENSLRDVYPLDDEMRSRVESYSRRLEDDVVSVVEEAFERLEPAALSAANGVARFAVNRRENDDDNLDRLTELEGPSDHSVPVLRVANENGNLLAVAFGYACHTTTLSGYQWSGDYAGFAQLALGEKYPEATALFFAGAGADQNPLPRRTVPLARQYGQTLAAAVERVLAEPMETLDPELKTAYSEIPLALNSAPAEEDLVQLSQDLSGWQQRWASRLLAKVRGGEALRTQYPYPVQMWQLGDQTIVALGGEVVVGYAIRLKRIFGQDLFVLGYSNDVMAYIPSARILREGGYEGARSQRVYGLPSTWAASIEEEIVHEVLNLAEGIGVSVPVSSIEGE